MTVLLNQARASLQSGQTELALQQLSTLTAAEPTNAQAFSMLAMASVKAGRLAAAQTAMRQAFELDPLNADFCLTAANIEQDLGNLEAAGELLQRAIRLRPGFSQAHNNLGILLTDLGKIAEASHEFMEAIRCNPQYARAYANLAAAQMRLLQLSEAVDSAKRATELQPNYAHGHHLLASAHNMLGDPHAAEAALSNALRLKPDLVESSLLMAQVLSRLKRQDNAEKIIRNALTLSPGRAELWTWLGDLVSGRDDLLGALDAYQRSLELRPNDLTTMARAALLLPNIYASEAHLAACRERYEHGVDYLLANVDVLSLGVNRERFGNSAPSNFLLAYQGGDDRQLQRRYGEFIHKLLVHAIPEQADGIRTQQQNTVAGRRMRVGFLSRFFFNSTVGNYFASWITDLDRSVFEVFVYQKLVVDDELAAQFRQSADHYVLADENFTFFSQRIAADKLDILIYPELGMDMMCFLMAAMRLAPVQISAWGHPVTPGLTNIDYYLSCAAMEPANAQAHYNERLLTLPGIGSRYTLPTVSGVAASKARADYQLPENANLYLCSQSLFKVHPANDRVLVTAMANDPQGVLVMFAGQNEGVTQRFIARLAKAFAEQGLAPQGRVKLLPYSSHDDFKRINALCDVMLDTLHWSGGNTSLDALAMGLPTVTLPGKFMRGRQTMGMLTLLGVDELIATSVDEYLTIAKRVATGKPYRDALSKKILASTARLFDDPSPTEALGAILQSLGREVIEGLPSGSTLPRQ